MASWAYHHHHTNKLTFLISQHVEPPTLQGGQSLQNALTTASEQQPDVAPVGHWPLNKDIEFYDLLT